MRCEIKERALALGMASVFLGVALLSDPALGCGKKGGNGKKNDPEQEKKAVSSAVQALLPTSGKGGDGSGSPKEAIQQAATELLQLDNPFEAAKKLARLAPGLDPGKLRAFARALRKEAKDNPDAGDAARVLARASRPLIGMAHALAVGPAFAPAIPFAEAAVHGF